MTDTVSTKFPNKATASAASTRTDCLTWNVCDAARGRGPGSAECEAVRLGARLGELDLEEAVGYGSGLADQLVGALLAHRPAAVRVHVGPAGVLRELAVEEDAERNRCSRG